MIIAICVVFDPGAAHTSRIFVSFSGARARAGRRVERDWRYIFPS